jgi:SecD/SecF fusion protein
MNRSQQIRVALIVVVLLLSIWGLWPTIRAASYSAEERALARSDSAMFDPQLQQLREKIDSADAKAIRLGLDLKGGMYIVLEIDAKGMTTDQARDALQRVREIIRNRIDQFGVSEPVIQTQGNTRLIVQLPGLQDIERAKNLIGRTAQLAFQLVRPPEDYQAVLARLDDAFRGQTAAVDTTQGGGAQEAAADSVTDLAASQPDTAAADTSLGNLLAELPPVEGEAPEAEEDEYLREHPFSGLLLYEQNLGSSYGTPYFVARANRRRVMAMLASPEARVVPREMEFVLGSEEIPLRSGERILPVYLLNSAPALTGDRLASAHSTPSSDRPGGWEVSMTLDRRGARQFAKVTGENIGRLLAISLDDRVASAPRIQTRIPNGRARITGTFTNDEAQDLALLLRAGALPTDVHIEMERTVGPSLGRESIRNGVSAALYGSLFVILFILIYYRATGLIAVTALVSNVVILLAVLGQFGLVLTLPGIAGIILTVGMAVDANVLINERIREELRKNKTIRAAVEAGYHNATRAIVDANLTTLIAGVILWWFGTGPIKGFAVTLSIGIFTSVFTALVLTRVIMELRTRNRAHGTLSI